MQNQKGNLGVIVSFIIVIGLIGLVIYLLMNKPLKEDPLEGIKVGEINEQQSQGEAQEDDQTQPKQQDQLSNNQKNMNPNTKILSNFTPVSKVANLEKIDIIKGDGKEVKAGDTVSVHYTGAVASTGAIFQSSKDFGTEPITFPLSGVIKGWTDGIPGMKIGGTRRLVIPAEMAYGANPPGGSGIPANADLVFDVELVAIK
jgi:FKBP-type peptidyl-prolyl cis-trans isomerase